MGYVWMVAHAEGIEIRSGERGEKQPQILHCGPL